MTRIHNFLNIFDLLLSLTPHHSYKLRSFFLVFLEVAATYIFPGHKIQRPYLELAPETLLLFRYPTCLAALWVGWRHLGALGPIHNLRRAQANYEKTITFFRSGPFIDKSTRCQGRISHYRNALISLGCRLAVSFYSSTLR